MNATTPLRALVACLAASLACAPASADETESCLPVQTGDEVIEYHPECMPSSSGQDEATRATSLAGGVADGPGVP